MLDKIQFKPVFSHLGINDELHFRVWINDESFEYSMGCGYVKTTIELKKNGIAFGVLANPTDTLMRKVFGKKRPALLPRLGYEIPTITNVLHCLFLDSQARSQCFQDWADELGYSSDSIKAFRVYEACLQNAFRLRMALGGDYHSIREYIESLEL